MIVLIIIATAVASAILGRLVLTRDEAVRTLKVRVPAAALLLIAATISSLFLVFFAAACFIGGSFYGIGVWWWPSLEGFWTGMIEPFYRPVLKGSWEQ